MKKEGFHLAQVNIAKMKGKDINDPIMADFVAQLDEVNSLAEQSKGFVWRLKDDEDNATAYNPFDDIQIIINFSVWESITDLQHFVFQGHHLEVMKQRRNWFESFGKAYIVMWFIPIGYTPTLQEAVERLEYLQENGASEYAFNFKYARQLAAE